MSAGFLVWPCYSTTREAHRLRLTPGFCRPISAKSATGRGGLTFGVKLRSMLSAAAAR